jgi:hypothetical protein
VEFSFLLPLLLFFPGAVLLQLISSRFRLELTNLEIVVMGSAFWSFLFVAIGYLTGIFSNFLREFFLAFGFVSMLLLLYGGYLLLKRVKISKMSYKLDYLNFILMILLVTLLTLVYVLTATHSIFSEFDAIFQYLPSAKSMITLGNLNYDYYLQTGLTTAGPSAIPINYAWIIYLSSGTNYDLALRSVPFIYIGLTSIVIYLSSKELLHDSIIAAIAPIVFLSIPVIGAITSNFSLYLDIPFTFLLFLSMFILLKISSKKEVSNFWWFMLGSAVSFMLLEKDMTFLILPSLVATAIILNVKIDKKKWRIMTAILISLLFTASYNFFFVWDLLQSSSNITILFIKELPAIIGGAIFFVLLLRNPISNLRRINKVTIFAFCFPMLPVLIYVLRNLLAFGAISYSLPLFNADWRIATLLMNQAGRTTSNLPMTLLDVLRWDTLFTSLNLGVAFLIPALSGLFIVIFASLKKNIDDARNFVILVFLLILITLWAWAFNVSYQGSELRRLYYFAPLVAIFTAVGTNAIASHSNTTKWVVHRFVIFESLILLYLWGFKLNISALNTGQLSTKLLLLGNPNSDTLLAFAFFFILSFYPFNINTEILRVRKRLTTALMHAPLVIPSALIALLLITVIVPFSFNNLSNARENATMVPQDWENGLYDVISYINSEIKDNSTIMTCYALPIGYFTGHPIIELTRYDGISNLLTLANEGSNIQQTTADLLERNIHYLLFPRTDHNYYSYFENLSKNFTFLSADFILRNPNLFLMKEFSKFELYKILTPEESTSTYLYLTSFENGWSPLNDFSQISISPSGLSVHASSSQIEIITDDNQDAFWNVGKANLADEITISNNLQTKESGNDSLQIRLNGTKNMVIDHMYDTTQNFSFANALSLYFYGANTTKSIVVTFHTAVWQDYYSFAFRDDFVGWKRVLIPLEEFQATGKASWDEISYIEILFGNRNATYNLDQFGLLYTIGVTGRLPPIETNSSTVSMRLAIKQTSLQHPPKLTVISAGKEELNQDLSDGNNLIALPLEFLKEGAVLRISYVPTGDENNLTFYYLGIVD